MKAMEALQKIIDAFKTGELPRCMAFSVFPPFDIPSTRWSFMNQIIIQLNGTMDARGFRQWKDVGRSVKKGAKAIYILAPRYGKDKGDTDKILRGFIPVPVFRVEDTEGKTLNYEEIEYSYFPLYMKASDMGISFSAFNSDFVYGYYAHSENHIALASPEEHIFFHELAHAGHHRACDLKEMPTWRKEVVAELTAQALCYLVGKKDRDTLGNTYEYISHYAKEAGKSTVSACLDVLEDVKFTLTYLLGKEEVEDGFEENWLALEEAGQI